MLSEYRQRCGDFQTNLNREDFLFRSGLKAARETSFIRAEYSDLFTSSVIAELHAQLAETSEARATERASLRRLIAFATEGNLAGRIRELSDEIERCEATGEVGGALDLRAEALEKLRAGAQALGYEHYLALQRELRGIDYEQLLPQAERVLAKTENRYVGAFASLLGRESGVAIDDAGQSDAEFLPRFTRFDHFFPAERILGIYRELFGAFGFNPAKQANVTIDSAARPRKQAPAFCAPVRVPDEVKLSVHLLGGQANYREFLRAAGHAQLFAWTSRNLYPEFRLGGDRAVPEAWGMLFENLLLDQHWLAGTFGFVESATFRHALAVIRLMSVRRQAALLKYETEIYAGKLANQAGARYVELLTDAVRVRFDEASHLRELDDAFRAESYLRASAFESQLREYLKTKFGLRWWALAKAGELLIDLWNTGQRHTVEELASMIGLGPLDFDWLTTELLNDID